MAILYVIFIVIMNHIMSFSKIIPAIAVLLVLLFASACDRIDNKTVPRYTVRIDLSGYAIWSTYGVSGMGEYRIFNRDKRIPANFPYNVNTYTGYGGVLLMMGIDGPMAYDLSCPVEVSPEIILSINADNFEAVCPRCNSHFDPLMNAGGPVSGVAINNKVGMRQYRVMANNGGYTITN